MTTTRKKKNDNRRANTGKLRSYFIRARLFLERDIRIGNNNVPKTVVLGIIAVVFMYVSVAGVVSVATPWLARGDTRQHIDYTWRLYHGDIPRWSNGIQYPPFVEMFGFTAEAASANPPLFYALHAPFIGPILESGNWQKAIAVGRALNIFIGILCILALAWAGWLFGGKRPALFAVAVPAMSVLTFRFTRLNVDYALDALLLLFTTLSLILTHKIIQKGLSTKYLSLLMLVSVLGMATKATYVVALFVSLSGIMLASFIHSEKKQLKKNLTKGALICAGLFLFVLLSIGWFYFFWNYKTSGNWFSSFPENYTGGRPVKSFLDVILSLKLWGLFVTSYTALATVSVAITSFAVAGILTMKKEVFTRMRKDKVLLATTAVMCLLVFGTFATQIEHAVGIGSINFRYMLPAMLPIALTLSYGLLENRRLKGQLVVMAAFLMSWSTLVGLNIFSLPALRSATSRNAIPFAVVKLLAVLFFVGLLLLSLSLFKLSRVRNTRRAVSR